MRNVMYGRIRELNELEPGRPKPQGLRVTPKDVRLEPFWGADDQKAQVIDHLLKKAQVMDHLLNLATRANGSRPSNRRSRVL
jgi:hypothetical protein